MLLDAIIKAKESRAESKQKANKFVRKDGISRSIVKSISWRAVGTVDTIIISWFVTGKPTLALSIGAVELVTKMVLYTIHERVWEHISYGKKAVYIDMKEDDKVKHYN
ncbi:MAG: DUF2061 domain-containing protein [Bacteroidetes bacterium]|nr:DUF2061 domain-containing protein [Bacteroidota bacterium]GDX48285.1 hypothetical protein LBMAG25_11030 [Bacteroidota bacterium]